MSADELQRLLLRPAYSSETRQQESDCQVFDRRSNRRALHFHVPS